MISFEINNHGAELQSLCCNGKEYLWQGDPQYWGRRAPILFPIVGRLSGDNLRIEGKTYTLKQHGFARDSEFKPCADGYMMERSAHPNYPYDFDLFAKYESEGNTLSCKWTVVNRGNNDMHFQIGAHPAFNLPDYNTEDKVHGYLQCFDSKGEVVIPLITNHLDNGLRYGYGTPKTLFNDNAVMAITNESFKDDAILIEGGQVASVTLFDKQGRNVLTVSCPQAEAFGLWAPSKSGCPFICIEPWCGIADRYDFEGDISERQYNHRLAPKESYAFNYSIEIH